MSHSSENPVEVIVFSLESDEKKRQALYRSLSSDEVQRAARFRFDKHRNRFIVGRGTIREILAAKGECASRAISFELNEYGKPSVHQPQSLRQLRFNASSSATAGAIAISPDFFVGLDIERIKPEASRDNDLIVENEFTDDEYRWYRNHDEAERIRAFYRLWTCKEAYLKALGIGLSGKLNGFSIDLRGDQPRISYTELEAGEKSQLSLYQFDISDDIVACLALPQEEIRFDITYW